MERVSFLSVKRKKNLQLNEFMSKQQTIESFISKNLNTKKWFRTSYTIRIKKNFDW